VRMFPPGGVCKSPSVYPDLYFQVLKEFPRAAHLQKGARWN